MAPRAESVRSDDRYPRKTGSSYHHVPRDTTLKFFPADLDPAYKSLRRKLREVKNKIDINFPKRRSSMEDELEQNSPANLADSFEEKPGKVEKKDQKNSSVMSDLFNASMISHRSGHGTKNAFRNMKRILHSRGNDVIHAKYHKSYVSGLVEETHESKMNLTLDEPLLAFYSPYTNTVEKSTKIPDYKVLVGNARDKSVAKVTKFWTEKILKQKEFINEKVNSITEYIEKEKMAAFAKEVPEPVVAPVEEERPKSQMKPKKRPVSQFSGNGSRSPVKSRQSSMDSLRGSPRNSSNQADGTKNTVSESRPRGESMAKIKEKEDSFVKEESMDAVDGTLPSLSASFVNRLSHGNSTTSMMHQRNNHRKKKSNGNYSFTEPNNRAGKDGRAHSTRFLDDKSRDKSYTEINRGTHARLTPAEYDDKLKFSNDLFNKGAKRAVKKLNRMMNKYNNVKNHIDTVLNEKLRKMGADRHELLLDKRRVVIRDEKINNLNTQNANIMRKKFELSLQDRKAQNRKQIKICEDVVEYLKRLPFSVHMEKFSFLDYLRGILEKGTLLTRSSSCMLLIILILHHHPGSIRSLWY